MTQEKGKQVFKIKEWFNEKKILFGLNSRSSCRVSECIRDYIYVCEGNGIAIFWPDYSFIIMTKS